MVDHLFSLLSLFFGILLAIVGASWRISHLISDIEKKIIVVEAKLDGKLEILSERIRLHSERLDKLEGKK